MTARLDDPSFKLTGSAALSLIGGVAGNRHCADCGAREPEWYACVRVGYCPCVEAHSLFCCLPRTLGR